MKEIADIVRFWKTRSDEPLALATLVAARGSSYRRPGARMLISASGQSAGGVSAGCIEEEVIACAQKVLRTGLPEVMTFDTRLRFGCHGTIEIFVEPVAAGLMSELRDSLRQRQSCRLETVLHGKRRGTRLCLFEETAGAFVQMIEAPLQLLLIGDSSDTAALRDSAALLGWEVRHVASSEVTSQILDDRTAVVIATHNFGRDCSLLRALLPAGLKYLGLIGSRRRRDDLLFDVLHDDVVCRSQLYAPAGLHLGAESPEEVALSVVAEIQCVFGAGTAQHLRHRKMPIHEPACEAIACAGSAA